MPDAQVPGTTDRPRATVVRLADARLAPGPVTAGMDRRELLDDGDRWVGWVRTEPGLAGGWHTHGDRDSYVYMLRGEMRIDFGPGGREHVIGRAGDLIFNPARMVHRETTGPGEAAEGLVVRVGPGPLTVNVEGPDAD
jgi:uncharacterized RmlC-like cupin family protein